MRRRNKNDGLRQITGYGFWYVFSKEKRTATHIETAQKYIELISNVPFTIVDNVNKTLHDYEKSFKSKIPW